MVRLAGIVCVAITMTLLYWSLRFAWADWLSKDRTPASIKAAIGLAPSNWEFYEDRAEIAPGEALEALRQAAALNPVNPGIRLELAASAEADGHFDEAEANLREAVALDRNSGPRTLLAEFYFRRRNLSQFWPAAKAALQVASNASVSLFQDCWSLTSDGEFILKNVLPHRREIVLQYLEFLLAENHLQATQPVAMMIMARPCCSTMGAARKESLRSVLIGYIDQMAAHNSAESALTAWNWLVTKNLIPYKALGPDAGSWLTNGDFMRPVISQAFDWHLGEADGISIEDLLKEHLLRITFSGRQPEHCELVSQYVALWPGPRYRIRARYLTSNIDPQSGLRWRVVVPAGTDLLKSGDLPGGTDTIAEREETFSFGGPLEPTVARLVLEYDRPFGMPRTEGTVEIRRVDGGLD